MRSYVNPVQNYAHIIMVELFTKLQTKMNNKIETLIFWDSYKFEHDFFERKSDGTEIGFFCNVR